MVSKMNLNFIQNFKGIYDPRTAPTHTTQKLNSKGGRMIKIANHKSIDRRT